MTFTVSVYEHESQSVPSSLRFPWALRPVVARIDHVKGCLARAEALRLVFRATMSNRTGVCPGKSFPRPSLVDSDKKRDVQVDQTDLWSEAEATEAQKEQNISGAHYRTTSYTVNV